MKKYNLENLGKLARDLKKNGSLDKFVNTKTPNEGLKILKRMYRKSDYYEERKPMNPKYKGKRQPRYYGYD